MTRRGWWLLLLATAACRNENRPAIAVFPERVDGGWRRVELRVVPVSEAPDPVPRNSVERLEAAVYEGPGRLEARAYELTSPTVGLDLAQRWRPSADTVFFWAGRYFVVVKWQQADRGALRRFTREIEHRVK